MRALAVDAEEALLDYLEMFYQLGRAGQVLQDGRDRLRHHHRAGLRDVLLTGKVKEAVTRTDRTAGRVYDAVVLDAPPTGRIGRFLNVTAEVARLAKVGPIKTQSDGVIAVLRSPHDGGARGHAAGGDAGAGDARRDRRTAPRRAPGRPVIVNAVRPAALPARSHRRRAAPRAGRRRPAGRPATGRRPGAEVRRPARRRRRGRAAASARGAGRRSNCRAAGRCRDRWTLGRLFELAGVLDVTGRCGARRHDRPWRRYGLRRTPVDRRSTSTRCSTTRGIRIIVCCGAGGVGKTTTAAALALRAAEQPAAARWC